MIIETDRLLLRPLARSDLDDFARTYADPEVMRFIGDGSPATLDATAEWLERHLTLFEANAAVRGSAPACRLTAGARSRVV